MDNYSHFKPGIQYSHYTGAERLEIVNYAALLYTETNEELRKEFYQQLQANIQRLTNKISYLDKLNNLK